MILSLFMLSYIIMLFYYTLHVHIVANTMSLLSNITTYKISFKLYKKHFMYIIVLYIILYLIHVI